ncbi:MAG: hypothetical protein MJ025_05405 [Victivallaceae bacterium]|nr:hypothetical protein [Victivallaceae bacterium]
MIHAALDPVPDGISFAVIRDGNTLVDLFWQMAPRDSAALPGNVISALKDAGLTLGDVNLWSVGSGPGSFTSLRAAAALVSGWCLGKDVKCRCVPGAVALARAAGVAGKSGMVYDGRNHEVIYFGLDWKDGEPVPNGMTKVLDAEQAKAFFSEDRGTLACHASELPAIRAIVPESLAIKSIEAVPATGLAYAAYAAFDGDLTKLVYVRPAVVSTPKQEAR